MKTRKVIWGVCIVLAVVLILTVFSFARKMHYVRLAKAHEGVYVSETGASFYFGPDPSRFLLWGHKSADFTYYYPENKGSAGFSVKCVSADHWVCISDERSFERPSADLTFLPDGSAELYYAGEYQGIFIKTE